MNPKVNIPHTEIRNFCSTYAARELAIFGSAVRDDFNSASDIDVLIDLAPDARIGLITFQRMRDELSVILGRSVDLLTRGGLNRHIRDEVLREAEIIHAGNHRIQKHCCPCLLFGRLANCFYGSDR